MSIEMPRLILKEIQEELSNIDRILNEDYEKVSKECEKKLIKILNVISEEL